MKGQQLTPSSTTSTASVQRLKSDMSKEEYNILITQMAATIFAGEVSRIGSEAYLFREVAVRHAQELARLAGIEEPKE